MNFDKLRRLAERNEASLFNRGGHRRTPPYYYDSLRHALGFYFNTFHTKNLWYTEYSRGLKGKRTRRSWEKVVDEENTVNAMILFERFFELFLKDLLSKTHLKFSYSSRHKLRGNKAQALITQIRTKKFEAAKWKNKYLAPTFRETIDRFYGLVELSKAGNSDPIVKKFTKILKEYSFLDSENHKATFYLLSWYRDRILHSGKRVPTLWLFDYIISQRVIPIILDIAKSDTKKVGESLFYFKTITGINVMEEISKIKYEFNEVIHENEKIFENLMHLGHLKELGRANLNMNTYVRRNYQAGYEYNYKDPKGRAARSANAEKSHEHFKEIKRCPCCGEETVVVYRHTIDDVLFNPGQMKDIDWIKCSLCDYHLRYHVGEPKYFNLHSEIFFDSSNYIG